MEGGQGTLLSTESTTLGVASAARVRAYSDLPAALAQRHRGRAWMLSLAVHVAVLALALWGLSRKVTVPPPALRLVFVAPPSPPPLGRPERTGNASVAEAPPRVAQPKRAVRKRVVMPKQTVKLQDHKPEPPAVEQAAAVPTEPPQAGVAPDAVGGTTGGVTGGVVGGTLGGTVGGTLAGPLRLDQAVQPPVIVSRVEPDYPYAARLQGIEGQVLLEAIVDRTGRIEAEIKVLKSVAMLDKAAIEALRQWRFTPGRDANGQTVRVIVEVPIRFVLE